MCYQSLIRLVRFLKYCVTSSNAGTGESVSHRTVNALDIMMDAAARGGCSLGNEFVRPVDEQNKKDKFFNDILHSFWYPEN